MNAKRISLCEISLLVLCFFTTALQAELVVIDDDFLIDGGDYDEVSVCGLEDDPIVLTITGGNILRMDQYAWSLVQISDGYVTDYKIHDNSNSTISGGTVHTLLGYGGYSKFVGGSFDLALLTDDTILEVSGGDFELGAGISAAGQSSVHLYGYDFNFTQVSDSLCWKLTGYFGDGSYFAFILPDHDTFTHFTLHVVPEPAATTAVTLLWAACIARRKSR